MLVIKYIKLSLLTIIFLIITHALVFVLHELAHSFMAYFLGFKSNPFFIAFNDPTLKHISGSHWANLLLLSQLDENVNYKMIFASGHGHAAALIAFAGPGIANGTLFALSYFLLKKKIIKQKPAVYYFIFLFNLMNLGNFYDYIPVRAFAHVDDVYNFVTGLNISPWITFIVFGYIVTFLIWQFFSKTLLSAYQSLQLASKAQQSPLMILCVLILFGYFGGFPYIYFIGEKVVGPISYFISATSFIAIPGLIYALWPRKNIVLKS